MRTRLASAFAAVGLAVSVTGCLPPGGGGGPTTTTTTTTTAPVDCAALEAEAIAANTAAILAADAYQDAVEGGTATPEELASLLEQALAASATAQALGAEFEELC